MKADKNDPIREAPGSPEGHEDALRRAVALYHSGDLDAAGRHCRKQLAETPASASLHHLLGLVQLRQGDLAGAEQTLTRAVELDAGQASFLSDLGVVLKRRDRLDDALAAYDRALRLRPDLAEAHNNRGNILYALGQDAQALAAFDTALGHRPEYADAHLNRGLVLLRQDRLDDSRAAFTEVLRLQPDHAEACFNLAVVCRAQDRRDEALEFSRRAVALQPSHAAALAELALQMRHLCLWDGLDEIDQRIRAAVNGGSADVNPFNFLMMESAAGEQLRCARQYACKHYPPAAPQWSKIIHSGPINNSINCIRIGYLSADFQEHATASLIAEVFELHDRGAFEVHGYSYGPDDASAMRARLVKACDRFTDVRKLSFAEAAARIRADAIDILIDLKGYTKLARPEIAALRPAPVQLSYLGYPGTLGAEFMDYLITDHEVTPAGHEEFFSEKLVRLPDCYQANDRRRPIADRPQSRAECGLPDDAFVYCCLNSPYKITAPVFTVWMRLLQAAPGSVLWLLAGPESGVRDNLHAQAAKCGVDPQRLVFAAHCAWPEHLARLRLADLFLDTSPVNAHTTASDALWAGLPLLTCRGGTFVARVGASLLKAAGLPELVTENLEQYQRVAMRLAADAGELAGLRKRLEAGRLRCALFDSARFTRHLEDAYHRIWETHRSGAGPRHIDVPRRPEAGPQSRAQSMNDSARIPFDACPMCAGQDTEAHKTVDCRNYPHYDPQLPGTIAWLRCRSCGHVFTSGYFSEAALAVLLKDTHSFQQVGANLEQQRAVWAATVERVTALRGGDVGKWLDVGFGNGALLFAAQEWGYETLGIDLRPQNVEALRALGVEAKRIALAELGGFEGFDVISLADVLEHMPSPREAIRHAARLLRPKGLLFIATPNMDSAIWRALDRENANPYWAEMEHYHNFTRARLYKLLRESGLEPVHYGVSTRYRCGMDIIARKNVTLRNDLKRADGGALRLNVGCGRNVLPGWINLDAAALPGVDIVADLEGCRRNTLPLADDSVDEFLLSHVLEHLRDPLALMEELHRVAKPKARALIRMPFGASDDAFEDPTHVRQYFAGSFGYFSQPFYWRADYGYRGDWLTRKITLLIDRNTLPGLSPEKLLQRVRRQRNIVREMVAELEAVKPIRAPRRELQAAPAVTVQRIKASE